MRRITIHQCNELLLRDLVDAHVEGAIDLHFLPPDNLVAHRIGGRLLHYEVARRDVRQLHAERIGDAILRFWRFDWLSFWVVFRIIFHLRHHFSLWLWIGHWYRFRGR